LSDSVEPRGLARPGIGKALLRLVLFTVPLIALFEVADALWVGQVDRQHGSGDVAIQLVCCGIAILAYWILVRLLERRSASELSLAEGARWAAVGVLVGALMFCCVYAILWAAGVARFAGVRGFGDVAAVFGVSIFAGITEEIMFRGILYRIVENAFGTIAGLVVSSALFGLVHLGNPGATLVTALMIAIEAGLMLGLAYTVTRSLWFPIGIHFAWNFTQSGIFGAPLSGYPYRGIFDFALSGPDILTGGEFGPEMSILTPFVCLMAAGLFGWATVRAGYWRTVKAADGRAQA